MSLPTIFLFSDYWWFYLIFTGFVCLVLSIDLGIFNKNVHAISTKESAIWTFIWVTLAIIFNIFFYLTPV